MTPLSAAQDGLGAEFARTSHGNSPPEGWFSVAGLRLIDRVKGNRARCDRIAPEL
jgi:hypothetical protein